MFKNFFLSLINLIKFIKFNTVYNEFQYKNSKREHQKSIRENKNRYYKTKLENCKGDGKKTWRIINECLNRPDKKSNKSKRKEHLIFEKVRVIAHHLGIDFFDDDTESDESDDGTK